MCQFKKNQYIKAYEMFEDCLIHELMYFKSLKMMIIINILDKKYYEASHLLDRISK